MSAAEDVISSEYPYFWDKSSSSSLREYLDKWKPSMVRDDGTKPWLWVSQSEPPEKEVNEESAIQEALTIVEATTERVEAIQNDESIPVRANKKKGTKSKKELREAAQTEATEKLEDVSVRHGYVSGKWLILAPPDKVDFIWSTVATSLIEGPLAPTSAYRAKVSTSPRDETPNYQHVLCIYMPDVYDKERVIEVMKVLLRQHGLNLLGVKSNLYTAIRLDSKHASGIQSTVWKNTALMKDTEIKELRDQFYKEKDASKATSAVDKSGQSSDKAKPKFKRKAVDDDPFASDDEESKEKVNDSGKPAKSKPKQKTKAGDVFASGDELDLAEEEGKRKATLAATKAKATGLGGSSQNARKKRKLNEDDDEDEDGEQPRRKRAGRSLK